MKLKDIFRLLRIDHKESPLVKAGQKSCKIGDIIFLVKRDDRVFAFSINKASKSLLFTRLELTGDFDEKLIPEPMYVNGQDVRQMPEGLVPMGTVASAKDLEAMYHQLYDYVFYDFDECVGTPAEIDQNLIDVMKFGIDFVYKDVSRQNLEFLSFGKDFQAATNGHVCLINTLKLPDAFEDIALHKSLLPPIEKMNAVLEVVSYDIPKLKDKMVIVHGFTNVGKLSYSLQVGATADANLDYPNALQILDESVSQTKSKFAFDTIAPTFDELKLDNLQRAGLLDGAVLDKSTDLSIVFEKINNEVSYYVSFRHDGESYESPTASVSSDFTIFSDVDCKVAVNIDYLRSFVHDGFSRPRLIFPVVFGCPVIVMYNDMLHGLLMPKRN